MIQPQAGIATSRISTDDSVADEHVFLIGRPPIGEFLGFVKNQTVDAHNAAVATLANQWREANDHIRELEAAEAGLADNPPIEEIDPSLRAMASELEADPIFKRSFEVLPTSLHVVELDRLIVYQKHINLAFVDKIKGQLGPKPTAEQIFRLCIPTDHPQPRIVMGPVANNAFVFSSPSTDLRFLDATLFKPDQVRGHKAGGPISGVVGLVVGFGSNFVNAVRVNGRLILNNGSHRAYALRDMGIKRVPCLIQHVSREEEIEAVGIADLQQRRDVYLKAPRPPLLKDYFDAKLRQILLVPRHHRQIRVAFQVENLNVPAGGTGP